MSTFVRGPECFDMHCDCDGFHNCRWQNGSHVPPVQADGYIATDYGIHWYCEHHGKYLADRDSAPLSLVDSPKCDICGESIRMDPHMEGMYHPTEEVGEFAVDDDRVSVIAHGECGLGAGLVIA